MFPIFIQVKEFHKYGKWVKTSRTYVVQFRPKKYANLNYFLALLVNYFEMPASGAWSLRDDDKDYFLHVACIQPLQTLQIAHTLHSGLRNYCVNVLAMTKFFLKKM